MYLEQKRRCEPVEGHFNYDIILSSESRRSNADGDNRTKVVLDFLERVGLIENDCLADGGSWKWGSADKGMCKVYVWKVAGNERERKAGKKISRGQKKSEQGDASTPTTSTHSKAKGKP